MRGTPMALVYPNGAVDVERYDAFGIEAPDNVGRFGFTGQMRLPELGLAYFKNRFYDPALGRFLSPDPLGMVDGPNLYAYVLNDPINNVDPWGLEQIESNESEPVTILGIRLRGRASGSSGGIGSVADSCPAFEANANDTGILPTSGCARGRGGPRGVGEARHEARCTVAPISPRERKLSRKGDRRAYWESRLRNGDPLAKIALAILNNEGIGAVANGRLWTAIAERNGLDNAQGSDAIHAEINQIGVELLRAHVNAVDANPGSLSPVAVAQYHFGVFRRHGLPNSTFGGTSLTGLAIEALLTSPLWLDCP